MITLQMLPQFGADGDAETLLSVSGDILTIDGTDYDLSDAPGTWPDTRILGEVTRIGNTSHVLVRVTLGPTADPNQPSDPAIWLVENADGEILIPAARLPEPETQETDSDDAL